MVGAYEKGSLTRDLRPSDDPKEADEVDAYDQSHQAAEERVHGY